MFVFTKKIALLKINSIFFFFKSENDFNQRRYYHPAKYHLLLLAQDILVE